MNFPIFLKRDRGKGDPPQLFSLVLKRIILFFGCHFFLGSIHLGRFIVNLHKNSCKATLLRRTISVKLFARSSKQTDRETKRNKIKKWKWLKISQRKVWLPKSLDKQTCLKLTEIYTRKAKTLSFIIKCKLWIIYRLCLG